MSRRDLRRLDRDRGRDRGGRGEACVHAGRLLEVAKSLTGESATLEADDGALVIQDEVGRTTLYGVPVGDAPNPFDMLRAEPGGDVAVAAGYLAAALERVIVACTSDHVRYATDAVAIVVGSQLELVATDARRLALATVPLVDRPKQYDGGLLLLPSTAAKRLLAVARGLEGDDPVHLALVDQGLALSWPGGRMSALECIGAFPPYRDVIPRNHEVEASLVAGELLDAVNRARTVVTARSSGVVLRLGREEATIVAQDREVGAAEITIPCTGTGEATIVVAARYLADTVARAAGEEVVVRYVGPGRPLVVIDGAVTHVVMPIQA